jgi:hypothetical protein
VIRSLGVLSLGVLAFWAVLAGVVYLLWDHLAPADAAVTFERTFTHSVVAMLLCLLPCVVTFLWANRGGQQSPEQLLLAVLGGTGVRMFFVLGVSLALTTVVPYFKGIGFWLWVLAFYLFTLTLEMRLLIRARSAAGGQGK